jgi:hypothetical protein
VQVFVTARGDSYHQVPECRQIVAGQEAARRNGNEVHPPRKMSLDEAQAWKPVTKCPSCWVPIQQANREPYIDVVEVRYEIGFSAAATFAKGYLRIPREQWLAVLPEDRDDFVLDLIKKQAAEQLRISYRTIE